jgi:pyruvate-formate lyase-activating enzyme
MSSERLRVLDNWREHAFVEVPGILMLRLMSRCNNKCTFCMVEDEIQESDDIGYEAAIERIVAQPAGTRIEFFGGEPTIYPKFLELLTLARALGYECSIATNGRIFASERYTDGVAALGNRRIYIRTSLYGADADLHDYYTRAPQSFDQTVRGIENIVRRGFRSQVNLVVMARNYHQLERMTEMVHSWGVPRIKFGNLVDVSTCLNDVARLADVRPHLERAIARAEQLGLTVTVEKTPVCIAGGRLDLYSTERDIGHWPRVWDDEGACRECILRPWCDGVDPDYARIYGLGELETVARIPRAAVRGTIHSNGDPEILKTHCVEWDGAQMDEEAEAAVLALAERAESRHGRLAVFPTRFIRA